MSIRSSHVLNFLFEFGVVPLECFPLHFLVPLYSLNVLLRMRGNIPKRLLLELVCSFAVVIPPRSWSPCTRLNTLDIMINDSLWPFRKILLSRIHTSNLIRIPVAQISSEGTFDVVPWCIPPVANRLNRWGILHGRDNLSLKYNRRVITDTGICSRNCGARKKSDN